MKDGWHKIGGYEVYVEDNCVTHGIKRISPLNIVTAYPYRKGWRYSNGERYHAGWWNCNGLSVSAFKSGVYRGTIEMF